MYLSSNTLDIHKYALTNIQQLGLNSLYESLISVSLIMLELCISVL